MADMYDCHSAADATSYTTQRNQVESRLLRLTAAECNAIFAFALNTASLQPTQTDSLQVVKIGHALNQICAQIRKETQQFLDLYSRLHMINPVRTRQILSVIRAQERAKLLALELGSAYCEYIGRRSFPKMDKGALARTFPNVERIVLLHHSEEWEDRQLVSSSEVSVQA
ncbi:hypothetical protein BU25DRAFT_463004 [Macroventuria anomochaeta]|uniref:Uncharacterized protein n=1 Tax=Macroventuria anomochaeta TaxID=301207 RepID=A0ACB6RKI5_9PLEO|nr:uncharacterized protein BU25DRAFT_463004 [Macroventuria anomochaeta]KAF2622243.1 hypothetical protein BU25DRAFT_463004 [Macroventuria anomochaeta]